MKGYTGTDEYTGTDTWGRLASYNYGEDGKSMTAVYVDMGHTAEGVETRVEIVESVRRGDGWDVQGTRSYVLYSTSEEFEGILKDGVITTDILTAILKHGDTKVKEVTSTDQIGKAVEVVVVKVDNDTYTVEQGRGYAGSSEGVELSSVNSIIKAALTLEEVASQ